MRSPLGAMARQVTSALEQCMVRRGSLTTWGNESDATKRAAVVRDARRNDMSGRFDQMMLCGQPGDGAVLVGKELDGPARPVVPDEGIGRKLMAEVAHHDGVGGDEGVALG